MRTTMLLLAAASISVSMTACAHGSAPGAGAQARAAENAARLNEALAGRTAGAAQDCVDQRLLESHRSYGNAAILFGDTASDEVVYVNRPPAACPGLDVGQGLRTRTTTTRLCRGDIVTIVDPQSRMELAGCALGPFTPYRRPGK